MITFKQYLFETKVRNIYDLARMWMNFFPSDMSIRKVLAKAKKQHFAPVYVDQLEDFVRSDNEIDWGATTISDLASGIAIDKKGLRKQLGHGPAYNINIFRN